MTEKMIEINLRLKKFYKYRPRTVLNHHCCHGNSPVECLFDYNSSILVGVPAPDMPVPVDGEDEAVRAPSAGRHGDDR